MPEMRPPAGCGAPVLPFFTTGNISNFRISFAMPDQDWVDFLQWALPQMHMRWQGFRKVRGQVEKRIGRRLKQLQLDDPAAYRAYLGMHPAEWQVLDGLCRVVVSRFYRDRLMFAQLEEVVLPTLAAGIHAQGGSRLRVWSAGCASGEEPYSVAIIWLLRLQPLFPDIGLEMLATDADPELLSRAETACYPHSSIKNLPLAWRTQVFVKDKDNYCLRPTFRAPVRFRLHDIRDQAPAGPFHLVLCRNLVFTYFDRDLQLACLENLGRALLPDGYLIVSVREQLPEAPGFATFSRRLGIYRKTAA